MKSYIFIYNTELSILDHLHMKTKFHDSGIYVILVLNLFVLLDPNSKYFCLIFKVFSSIITDRLEFMLEY